MAWRGWQWPNNQWRYQSIVISMSMYRGEIIMSRRVKWLAFSNQSVKNKRSEDKRLEREENERMRREGGE